MQNNHPFLADNRVAVYGLSLKIKSFTERISRSLPDSGFDMFRIYP